MRCACRIILLQKASMTASPLERNLTEAIGYLELGMPYRKYLQREGFQLRHCIALVCPYGNL